MIQDRLTLETPEQLEINYDIARLGSRFIAAVWDSIFIGLLQILVFFGGYLLFDASGVILDSTQQNIILAVLILLSFLMLWGYYVIFELLWNGQSPGKRIMGIRTVRYNGAPISLSESAIRNIVRIIDFFPAAYGFGVLSMFIDLKSRRLGDFAAGTLVVHDRASVSLDILGKLAVQDTRLLDPALSNLHLLAEEEVEAVRRFLQRRDQLANQPQLAAQLADRIRVRLELETPTPPSKMEQDLDLLKRVVAQYGQ